MDLFGMIPSRYEYYPVLLLDAQGSEQLAELNQQLVALGIKPSQLTKLPHISIDGVVCPEDDEGVMHGIRDFLSEQQPLRIEFSEMGYYPGRGGLTVKLGITNSEDVKKFNEAFMKAIGGKVTKLDLHLTLARYVSAELWEVINGVDVKLQSCFSDSVAIYKKQYKAKGAYQVINKIGFGESNF